MVEISGNTTGQRLHFALFFYFTLHYFEMICITQIIRADDVEELRNFFLDLEALFGRTQRIFENKDVIGAEYYKTKLESYTPIVLAMRGALTESLDDVQDESRLF